MSAKSCRLKAWECDEFLNFFTQFAHIPRQLMRIKSRAKQLKLDSFDVGASIKPTASTNGSTEQRYVKFHRGF